MCGRNQKIEKKIIIYLIVSKSNVPTDNQSLTFLNKEFMCLNANPSICRCLETGVMVNESMLEVY